MYLQDLGRRHVGSSIGRPPRNYEKRVAFFDEACASEGMPGVFQRPLRGHNARARIQNVDCVQNFSS